MFPKGEYKFDFIIADEVDDFIYGAKIVTSLTSSVKLNDTNIET